MMSLGLKRWLVRWMMLVVMVGWGLWPLTVVWGQTATPVAPISGENDDIPRTHIIEAGETLFIIAEQYSTTVEALQLVNGIDDPALIFAGQELLIPGGGGVAVPTVVMVQAGDSVAGLAEAYNTTAEAIMRNNWLLNPLYLVGGQRLVIESRTGSDEPQEVTGGVHVVGVGETLVDVARQYGMSVATLATMNELELGAVVWPGVRLRVAGERPFQKLTGGWQALLLRALPSQQGETLSLYVEHQLEGVPQGQFLGQTLQFAPYGSGYVAVIGIDAFMEPGLYRLTLSGMGTERPWEPWGQDILIDSAGFGTQVITLPESMGVLLEPGVRAEEDDFLATIFSQSVITPQWAGLFQPPVTGTVVTAGYGDARSYNGGPIEIYHSGIDFGAVVGTPVVAPANGTVVFTGTTLIRGNVIILDHGLGVMTAYYHLEEVFVNVGEQVGTGTRLGSVGSTGLSSGPHLHWDVRVHNVTVNGEQWLAESFP
ncbi:MAG TPA: peptidoglycan DD-metalloendopeptidase family protein [Anaerolineae bacterium]|nr:peptidoglycan DD-metalloendopeptidase family protein [Anaerolineae bacterium]